MATVGVTKIRATQDTILLKWTLTAADDGTPENVSNYADRTVTFRGTFGGATIVLEGSNETSAPATFATLTDPQGTAISKTSAAIKAVMENPTWIRPRSSGGDGTTAIVCELNCVRVFAR